MLEKVKQVYSKMARATGGCATQHATRHRQTHLMIRLGSLLHLVHLTYAVVMNRLMLAGKKFTVDLVPPEEQPVFTITPDRVVIKAKESATFTIAGFAYKPVSPCTWLLYLHYRM
jgi:hypothetical protein